ncbi:hypothetical protein UFOVP77_9 [uncultured Caudovirales phage]|uniref:Uncharacterized protein n=1 Tax=uncultured Caudovirales phage TaxID=2100421 RepID=A0A6J5KX80_9CAUD|nr:hypothetical protein UFOVP77_9 [uncultured Caudovirales phage]
MALTQVQTGMVADSAITTAKIADANVTTAKILDANVTDAKIAAMAASKLTGTVAIANGGSRLVKVHTYENNTRQVTSASANYTYFSWTITKVSSTSTLFIHAFMPGQGNDNSGDYIGIGIDGTMSYTGVQNEDIGTSSGNFTVFTQIRTGISSGSRSMTIQAIPVDGTSNRTVNIVNPNSSDDARNRQMGTSVIIYEIENA